MAAYALACIALAYGLGAWTHWRYALARTLGEVQASCRHRWGATFEVGEPTPRARTRFYKQACVMCAKQRDVNADGTVYVPPAKKS